MQRVVGGGVLGTVVVRVVGGDRRQAEGLRDAQQVVAGGPLDGDAVVHQLEEEVVLAEDVLELAGRPQRLVVLAERRRVWISPDGQPVLAMMPPA